MRAAVYARFSSENQREQSIQDQLRVCKQFASREGIEVLEDHIYFDEAQSGSLRARPGLEALKKAAEDKQFDVVLVDDSSRLSRDNQHFNTLLCLFQYWGISLISVSDGLDMREEHAKVAYQFRGIINELYLTDLRKKTHRGQMGQVLRGFSVGAHGYGYTTVPEGESKFDKKGRLRADGFKLAPEGLDPRPSPEAQRAPRHPDRGIGARAPTPDRSDHPESREAGSRQALLPCAV
jgi:site-specific DNA recombinase